MSEPRTAREGMRDLVWEAAVKGSSQGVLSADLRHRVERQMDAIEREAATPEPTDHLWHCKFDRACCDRPKSEHIGFERVAATPEPSDLPINDKNGPWCGCGQRLGHAVPNEDCNPPVTTEPSDLRAAVEALPSRLNGGIIEGHDPFASPGLVSRAAVLAIIDAHRCKGREDEAYEAGRLAEAVDRFDAHPYTVDEAALAEALRAVESDFIPEDDAHRWCDEDSGGSHRFDRAAWASDLAAAIAARLPAHHCTVDEAALAEVLDSIAQEYGAVEPEHAAAILARLRP